MDNNYKITWKIKKMYCYPEYNNNKDVVFSVKWICNGEKVVNDIVYTSDLSGDTVINLINIDNFTPYIQLQEEQVLGWLFNSMGEEQKVHYENAVINAINVKINPPTIEPPLPWIN